MTQHKEGGSMKWRATRLAILTWAVVGYCAAEPPDAPPDRAGSAPSSSAGSGADALRATAPGAATPGATLPGATLPPPARPAPGFESVPAWSPRPRRVATVPPSPAAATTTTTASSDQPAQFSSEAKWDLAGYNNDEVIYTIFITSRDPRIIRCTALLTGFFYENGEKHSVSDRQSTTVFPQQRVQAGNWQGMDKESGVNYSVKCRPT